MVYLDSTRPSSETSNKTYFQLNIPLIGNTCSILPITSPVVEIESGKPGFWWHMYRVLVTDVGGTGGRCRGYW